MKFTRFELPTYMNSSLKHCLAAVAVLVGFISLGLILLKRGLIGEPVYFSHLCLGAICAIAIILADRLKEFDLSKMRLVLSEFKETQSDIKLREQRIARIASISAEISAVAATLGERLWDEDKDVIQRKWLRSKAEQLLVLAESDAQMRVHILGFFHESKAAESLPHNSPEQIAAWEKIWGRLKADLDANS